MKKNKKAIISLKVLTGLIFSVTLIILTLTVFYKFTRLNDSSKDSFYELIRMIEDANKNNDEAKLESMNFRMDKDTIILGFSKEEKLAHITKPLKYGCEENNECICLLRDFDKTKLFAGEISGKVICEVIENLEFTNLASENDPFYKVSGGICISRSPSLLLGIRTSMESNNRQFRTVYAHKYKETVSVCEFLNEEKNSCIPVEYLNEDKAFEGMKKLAEFIESCKESGVKNEVSESTKEEDETKVQEEVNKYDNIELSKDSYTDVSDYLSVKLGNNNVNLKYKKGYETVIPKEFYDKLKEKLKEIQNPSEINWYEIEELTTLDWKIKDYDENEYFRYSVFYDMNSLLVSEKEEKVVGKYESTNENTVPTKLTQYEYNEDNHELEKKIVTKYDGTGNSLEKNVYDSEGNEIPQDNLYGQIDNEDDYCGCGLFDFDFYIPEGYGVKLTKDENGKLKLILKKAKEDTEKEVLVDTNFCQHSISYSEFDSAESPESNLNEIILDENLKDYGFCQGENSDSSCEEDSKNQITFVKDKNNNICIVKYNSDSLSQPIYPTIKIPECLYN